MHKQSHFLIFFVAFPLFSLCFGSYHEDPIHQPRPASLYTFKNQHFDPEIRSFGPGWNTDSYGSTTTTKRSWLSSSPNVVNVDDFGAKGNGQDDSKVHPIEHI